MGGIKTFHPGLFRMGSKAFREFEGVKCYALSAICRVEFIVYFGIPLSGCCSAI
jgi:hypothetical protein